MKKLTTIVILAALAASLQSAEPATTPNIIFILSDDLSYRDLSCYGQKEFATPHLDRLAMDGLRFTQGLLGRTATSIIACEIRKVLWKKPTTFE